MDDVTSLGAADDNVYDETVTYRDGLVAVLRNLTLLLPQKGKTYMPDAQKKVAINLVSMADGNLEVLDMLLAYYAEHAGLSYQSKTDMKSIALSAFAQERTQEAIDKQLEDTFIKHASE